MWADAIKKEMSKIIGAVALTGMSSKVLPLVDTVTAVEDSEGRVILLGVGEAEIVVELSTFESEQGQGA